MQQTEATGRELLAEAQARRIGRQGSARVDTVFKVGGECCCYQRSARRRRRRRAAPAVEWAVLPASLPEPQRLCPRLAT